VAQQSLTSVAGWPALLSRGEALVYVPQQRKLRRYLWTDPSELRAQVVAASGESRIRPALIGTPIASMSLALTSRCNMRCPRCFVFPVSANQNMSEPVVDAAIAFLGRLTKVACPSILLWGGEPTLNRTAMSAAIAASRRYLERCRIVVATNGALDWSMIRWLAEIPEVELQVSFEVSKEAQRGQKVLVDGRDSYRVVSETLSGLASLGKPAGLRATITEAGVPDLVSGFERMLDQGLTRRICVEPLHAYAGRSAKFCGERPEVSTYVQELLRLVRTAEAQSIEFYSQPVDVLLRPQQRGLICVLPDGQIVSTVAVVDSRHPHLHRFLMGGPREGGRALALDDERVSQLESRFARNVAQWCSDCPAYVFCAGQQQRDLFVADECLASFDNYRCQVQREVVGQWLEKWSDVLRQGRGQQEIILNRVMPSTVCSR